MVVPVLAWIICTYVLGGLEAVSEQHIQGVANAIIPNYKEAGPDPTYSITRFLTLDGTFMEGLLRWVFWDFSYLLSPLGFVFRLGVWIVLVIPALSGWYERIPIIGRGGS